MFESVPIEYLAVWEQRRREAVDYPAADRRGVLQRDLTRLLAEQAGQAPLPAAVQWLGGQLVRLGERLKRGAVTPAGNL